MASPPPGGPQAGPPPYPPYPPQTTYAPPIAPTPKKSNTLLIVVIVVVIIVVLVAIAWYAVTLLMRPVTNPQITVTGVSWTVSYPGSNHWFGNSPLTTCAGCPITVTFPNYQFTYVLTLTNQDTVAHNVTGISISGIMFNLVTASPDPTTSSPTVIAANGGSQAFTLTIQASPFTGSYTLSGTITTT